MTTSTKTQKPNCVPSDVRPKAYTEFLQKRLQQREAEHAQALASYLPHLVIYQLAKLACDPKADTTPPDLEALADDLTDRFVAIALNKFQTVLTGTFKE